MAKGNQPVTQADNQPEPQKGATPFLPFTYTGNYVYHNYDKLQWVIRWKAIYEENNLNIASIEH